MALIPKVNKNSFPSSHFEHEDRCPNCGDPCDVEKDMDEKDYCNNCRPKKKKMKSKDKPKKSILELAKEELEHLAFLSSYIHKKDWSEKGAKHLGLKYEYKSLSVPKEWRKKHLNTAFHVVMIYPNEFNRKTYGQLHRIFVMNFQVRNPFCFYNINQDGKLSKMMEPMQDDLFQMHKYLIERGYDIKSPS